MAKNSKYLVHLLLQFDSFLNEIFGPPKYGLVYLGE